MPTLNSKTVMFRFQEQSPSKQDHPPISKVGNNQTTFHDVVLLLLCKIYPLWNWHGTWKLGIGRWFSSWKGFLVGSMLVSIHWRFGMMFDLSPTSQFLESSKWAMIKHPCWLFYLPTRLYRWYGGRCFKPVPGSRSPLNQPANTGMSTKGFEGLLRMGFLEITYLPFTKWAPYQIQVRYVRL